MALLVVHRLEVIDIDHKQVAFLLASLQLRELLGKDFVEDSAVGCVIQRLDPAKNLKFFVPSFFAR